MIKYIFIIFLITHILCDFYFQSDNMSRNKEEKYSWVLLHSGVYAVAAMIILTIVMPGLSWVALLSFVLAHMLIDSLKYTIMQHKCMKRISLLLIDQMVHVLVIILITYSLRNYSIEVLFNQEIRDIIEVFELSEIVIMEWIVKLLLIHKPANLVIAGILSRYKPEDKGKTITTEKNAGRFIGTLERIIMVILMTIGQYSAVGLVLTAKSIARYDKISGDQEFAEYYLLGTLLSTIVAICVCVIF